MAKTLKERIQEQQRANFIGRSEHLNLFRNNFTSAEPILIFNIYGQGGVGKTYLSKQYITLAEESKCLVAYSDESIKSLLEWMESVSSQFAKQGAELSEFDKRYKSYLQETKALENDPEKPKGLLGGFVKSLTKGVIKEAKKIPGSELVGSFVDEDVFSTKAGEWADYVRRKMTNKDEVELVLHPIEVLSPIFWKDIFAHTEKFSSFCFFIDTFEETNHTLEKWLLEVLDSKHGEIPHNIQLIIAGRDELNPNKWSWLSTLTQQIPLEPFSEAEANEYLDINGITDDFVRNDIQNLSGRLPVLMAWLVETAKNSSGSLQDASETAVERFLKWIDDEQKRSIALAAALPRKLNQDIIESLLADKSKCKEYFNWLCSQPFVLRKGDHWTYHSVVRNQMLRYIRTRSPKEWSQYHEGLHAHYITLQEQLGIAEEKQLKHTAWTDLELEQLYHALCGSPDKTLPLAVNKMVKYWQVFDITSGTPFGETIKEAGIDSAHTISEGWGWRIIIANQQIEEEKYQEIQTLIEGILNEKWMISPKELSFTYLLLGQVFNLMNKYDEAILKYKKAIELKPDYANAYNNMGHTYYNKKAYDQAIEQCEKEIEIKPNYVAYYNMGVTYSAKEDYDEAILQYKKAIKLNPDDASTHYNMGNIYSNKKEYNQAIVHYKKAIELKPDDPNTYNNLGIIYKNKKEYDQAIIQYKKAVELKPDYPKVFNNMGDVYFYKKEYDQAIIQYKKAVELKPDAAEYISNLGFALIINGEIAKAKTVLEKGIGFEIEEGNFILMNLGHTYLALKNESEAVKYYKQSLSTFENSSVFWEGMEDDFQYLEQYGITRTYYDEILEKIKKEST